MEQNNESIDTRKFGGSQKHMIDTSQPKCFFRRKIADSVDV